MLGNLISKLKPKKVEEGGDYLYKGTIKEYYEKDQLEAAIANVLGDQVSTVKKAEKFLETIANGPWIASMSDTHPALPAVFADGGIGGATQVAIFPKEFVNYKEHAKFVAASPQIIRELLGIIAAMSIKNEK